MEIRFYDNTGREISTANKMLPPNGKIRVKVEDYLKTAGTIVLESLNENVGAEYWQIQRNGMIFTLPLQSLDESERYFINGSHFPSCSHSYIVLSDPYGSGPMVQMEFYSITGELIKIARKLLRPHGMHIFEVSDFAPKDILGKISVRSFGGNISLHYRHLCGKNEIVTAPLCVPSRKLFIDGFSTGARRGEDIAIVDVSAKGPNVEVKFFNSEGKLVNRLEKLVPTNGTVRINPSDYMDSVSDSPNNSLIEISSNSEVIADYWGKISQSIVKTSAISKPGNMLSISYFLPSDSAEVLLSLLNAGEDATEVKILFYDNDGKKLDSKEIILEPRKRINESVGHYFKGSRLGTIVVRDSNATLIASSHIFDLKTGQFLGKINAIAP